MILKTEHKRSRVKHIVKREWRCVAEWINDATGVAAVELAMILPVLVALLLGVVDGGNALLLSKKTMTAAQIVGDLVTRSRNITETQIQDSFAAARMALAPFSTASLGVDIVSIEFTGVAATPAILWRETYNADENPDALSLATGLGVQGEGVVVVTTTYHFDPIFLGGMFGSFDMEEVSITRGRRGPLVNRVD